MCMKTNVLKVALYTCPFENRMFATSALSEFSSFYQTLVQEKEKEALNRFREHDDLYDFLSRKQISELQESVIIF